MKTNDKTNKAIVAIIILLVLILAVAIAIFAVLIDSKETQDDEEERVFIEVSEKGKKSAAQQTAAALYKEAYALDLSDGTLDGKEGSVAITSVEGNDVTYTVSQSRGTVTVSFSYTDKNGYTVSFDGSDWAVEK